MRWFSNWSQPMYELHHSDCLAFMRTLPDNHVDAIVTDPPYELGFMGKSWDRSGIANSVEMWTEALRILKPGGHLLAFSGSRTYHRMTCAIEDAGFEVRDQIMWLYGSGFPKSHDVSKAIDKTAGAERTEIIGKGWWPGQTAAKNTYGVYAECYDVSKGNEGNRRDITAPATPEAQQWNGWGTALKPAHEPICVARKPLIGTVAQNVLTWGTGGVNVDGCRVGTGNGRWPANVIHDGSDEVVNRFPQTKSGNLTGQPRTDNKSVYASAGSTIGNLRFYIGDSGSAARFFYCAKASKRDRDEGLDSIEIISIFAAWEKEDLQARLLVDTATLPPKVTVESTAQHKDASAWSTLLFGSPFMDQFQTGTRYTTATGTKSTTGSKTLSALVHCITSGYIQGVSLEATDGTSRAENAGSLVTLTITIDEATALALGANHVQYPMRFTINARNGSNIHSTVKPTDLMRYLCRLVTLPNGLVFDPFTGSGSTGKAAILEGFRFIGCDMTAEYIDIARARIEHAITQQQSKLPL